MNDSNSPKSQRVEGKDTYRGVDKGLIKLFLEMSPEKRLLSNDNAIQTLTELKDAFQKSSRIRPQRSSAGS